MGITCRGAYTEWGASGGKKDEQIKEEEAQTQILGWEGDDRVEATEAGVFWGLLALSRPVIRCYRCSLPTERTNCSTYFACSSVESNSEPGQRLSICYA